MCMFVCASVWRGGGGGKGKLQVSDKKMKSILCRELGLLLVPPHLPHPHPPCALCCRRADVTLIMLIINCLCLSLPPSRQSSRRTRHTKSHLFRVFRFFFSRSHRRSRQSQRRPPPWPRPPLPPPMARPCINCFLMSPRLRPLKVVAH